MTMTPNRESSLENPPYITTVSLRLLVWIHRACWLPRSSSSRTRPRKSTSAQRLMTITTNWESSLEKAPYITTVSLRLPVWIHRACWLPRSSSSRTRPRKSTSAQRLMTMTPNRESSLENPPYITTVSLRLPVWIHRTCWLPRSSSSRTRPRKSTSAQRPMPMTPNRESSLENPPYITTVSLRLPVWIHRACWLPRSSSSRTRPRKGTSPQRPMPMTPNWESSL